MTVTASTLLSLPIITTGTESGAWGNYVNNGLTSYLDNAIAGTVTLTGDGAVTLSNTAGTDTVTNIVSSLTGAGTVSAQFAIIRVTGTLTTAKVLTAPSSSREYIVVNAATGSTVTIKASGQSGVSIAVGETATVYFNGTDYVKSATTLSGTGSVTSVAASVPAFLSIAGSPITTSGTLAITYSGTALPVANGGTGTTSTTFVNLASNVTGTLPVLNGGTGQTSYTDGQLLIGNSTGNTLTKATLTAGTGITIGNSSGAITISNSSATKTWTSITSTGTYTVPAGVTSIRVYAFGAGGNGATSTSISTPAGGGGGGGCAYGDLAVTPGDVFTGTISSGVATFTKSATTYLTANNGSVGTTSAGGAGGTASKDASVTNGGAYSGGAGGFSTANVGYGGGSSGSPLGAGYTGGALTSTGPSGGGGWGGVGGLAGGGMGGGATTTAATGNAGAGAGGPSTAVPYSLIGGISRTFFNAFTDPLLSGCTSQGGFGVGFVAGNSILMAVGNAGNGAGGGTGNTADTLAQFNSGWGGMGGGGGGASISVASAFARAGGSTFGGGGGGAYSTGSSTPKAIGGSPTYTGGGGGALAVAGTATAGTGGAAIILIYA